VQGQVSSDWLVDLARRNDYDLSCRDWANCRKLSILILAAVSSFATILHKDLRLELRSGKSTLTLSILALLILTVLTFALDAPSRSSTLAAGVLWVAMIFAGMAGGTRAIVSEWQNGCIRCLLLSPADRGAIYAAKMAASFLSMMVAQVMAVMLMVFFFDLDFNLRIIRLAAVLTMGTIGFASLTTLLAAIEVQIKSADLLLPLLVVPVFIPALIAGVKATQAALAGLPFAGFAQWLKILGACDLLFLAGGYLLFEQVISED
jgi:heme exporter protein B